MAAEQAFRSCSTWEVAGSQPAMMRAHFCQAALTCTCHKLSVRLAPLQGSRLARQAVVHRLIDFASATRRFNGNRLLIATGCGLGQDIRPYYLRAS